MKRWLLLVSLSVALAWTSSSLMAQSRSHPPRRPLKIVSDRPAAEGPGYFVDARKGADSADGDKLRPWKTLQHALDSVRPGDTVYLREGTFFENVIVSRVGTKDRPITVRSFPGEQAVLDGGLREFFEKPPDAWEPLVSSGEYRSSKSYPNLRDVMGAFGDSMIGLHTYHHSQDLRATNELLDWEDWKNTAKTDIKPVYCGPGLWYDRDTGRIHARLAATHVPDIDNYRGETDARKLPLVVAPFRSVPLLLDGARHLRFQDLTVRGGGHDTIVVRQCADIRFDNVTVRCGTYGLRVIGTHRLELTRCGLYGSVPPWTFRTDTSLRSYPGRPHRDITRFGTHALLVPEAGREYDVFSLPINDHWDIGYCDFADAHDGVYLGGVSMHFHHNRLFDLQDDGIYLSPMYSRVGRGKAEIHVHENIIGRSLTALAFGGPEKTNEDSIFLYRNLVDLREQLQTGRSTPKNARPTLSPGHVMGDHGSPPWSTMKIYHNTFVTAYSRFADMGLVGGSTPERPRRVFNNMLVHLGTLPPFVTPEPDKGGQTDGNLYWSPKASARQATEFFARFRGSPVFEKSKAVYPGGFDSHSLVAEPKFMKFSSEPGTHNDYRLAGDSPARNTGVDIPKDWPDPLRSHDDGKPDIGALPHGAPSLEAGRDASRGTTPKD